MQKFLARALLAFTLTIAFLTIGAPANAATTATAAVIAFTVPWPLVIALLVSTVLPLLVGLVTNSRTSSGVKAAILAALSALIGLLSELGDALTTGTTYDIGIGLISALGVFLVAVGMHFGLFKPVGAAAAVQKVGDSGAAGTPRI